MASGPERYLFNVKSLLESKGHEVIPFSINYPENEHSDYKNYFVNPVIKNSSFHISKIDRISIKDKVKIIINSFYNKEAKHKFEKLINDTEPDLIYILQFMGKISTSIFDVISKKNLPSVLRLSDFNLICGKNILYRNGAICEECIQNPYSVVKRRCIQDSFSKSLFFYLSRKYNNIKNFHKEINSIIVPSKFTKEKLQQSKKYERMNVVHNPTFIKSKEIQDVVSKISEEIRFCYFGRIADDKGLKVLLEAFRWLKEKGIEPKLTIFGDCENPYGDELINYAKKWQLERITFTGFMVKEKLFEQIKNFDFSIIPSVWYDNMPNSYIESQAAGLPVIASNIGSLTEMTTIGFNGYLFKSENSKDLSNCIENILKLGNEEIMQMKNNALHWVSEYCSEEKHYKKLISVFENVMKNNEKNSK